MSEKGLQILAKKQVLPRIIGIHLNKRDHCLDGMQHRVSFHKNIHHKKIMFWNLFILMFVAL